MGALQPIHLVLILVIVLIIFGAGRLTEVGGALGKGVRDFRANVESKDATSPATTAGARHCTNCGAELPSGARFCARCGAGVVASS
ncbi:MAG: twin-arginine translocase TatA/TatE family subunit [Chloroflexota bacterium]|nr:twin-arginine translocase TatA/TatE family subunit [Chloroflexota bacterium]MDE3192994.1 twin-arginine translocase TatA/TatE family subunit [Chloroflexota bacterium]